MKYLPFLFVAALAATEPIKLDFLSASEKLVKQNADLLTAEQNLRTAKMNYRAAYAGFFPQLTTGVNYTQGNSATTAQLGSQSAIYELYSASLGVSQSIFSGLSDFYKIKIARANNELSEANYQQVAARTFYELKAAWASLRLAEEQYTLAKETRARRAENVRMIRLRFQGGNENKGSLLLAESYQAQADRDTNQALRQKLTALTELRRVLGIHEESEIFIEDNVLLKTPPEAVDLSAAARATPEFKQALAQELSAEATASQAISPFFPTLNASGSLFRQGPQFFPEGNRWSVNVGVSYPIFSGGKDYYNLKASQSAEKAAKHTREGVETQRVAKLQQALQAWRDSIESEKVTESLLNASSVRAQIARVKYNNGLLSFDQWDIIENDLIGRQKSVLQSRYDRQIAQASWEQLTGEGPHP